MTTRVKTLVGLLPLAACVLALRTPVPAVRSQQNSNGTQRQRAHRHVRGNVRIDGDHHHEEVPHLQLPLLRAAKPPGVPDLAFTALEALQAPALRRSPEKVVLFEAPPARAGVLVSPSGRSPPLSA